MSQGWWNALWIVVLCWSLACSKSSDSASTGTVDGNTVATPDGSKAGSATLLPPEPDDDAGSAHISDKGGKARRRPNADDANPFQDATAKETSPIEQGPPRKSLAGQWILVLTRPSEQGFIDFHTGLVKVAAGQGNDAAGTWQAEWGSQSAVLPPATLQAFDVTAQQIHLKFEVGGTPLDFRGQHRNGVVLGNAVYGNCLPARLLPTKENSLDGFNTAPESADAKVLGQAFGSQDPKLALKGLQKFVADRPESPLGMMAWETLIMITAMTGGTSDEVQTLVNDYAAAMSLWGSRLQQAAKGNVAMVLAQTKFEPEFSLKYVATADKAITDESLKDLKDQLKIARENILTTQALKYVESDDADRAKKAFDFLTKLRQKSPFDPSVLYGLARYQETAQQTDAALELYAELASLPGLERFLEQLWSQKPDDKKRELPSETLAKLWEAKQGSSDGLDEFKESIYRKHLLSFAAEASSEPPAGNRVVLCELFTGGFCAPCVGADVATSGLEVSFPKSQVVVIRYHQHIPGPDPLTNADGEERFTDYYRLQSTPSVLLNGAPIAGVGGYLHAPMPGTPSAPEIYKGLKTLVEQQLAQKSSLKVRLAAKVDGDVLLIRSDVQGLDQLKDNEADDVRLRVVIAEDDIHFLARNGIRSHEMVVRRMLGGPEGTAAKDGKLAISESIPLADLRASLAEYLKKYEDGENYDFPAKPLDLRKLHIVAFVQNDESHEVLQTNTVSVAAGNSTASNAITPATRNTPVKTSSKKTKPVQ